MLLLAWSIEEFEVVLLPSVGKSKNIQSSAFATLPILEAIVHIVRVSTYTPSDPYTVRGGGAKQTHPFLSDIDNMFLVLLLEILVGRPVSGATSNWCGRQSANKSLSKITAHTLLSNVAKALSIDVGNTTKSSVSVQLAKKLFSWCKNGFPERWSGHEYRLLS